MLSGGSMTLTDLRRKRSATYNLGHVKEFSEALMAGQGHVIPSDFDKFMVDQCPTNEAEVALWLYSCLTKNNLIGPFTLRPNDLQPSHSSHLKFISESFLETAQDCVVLGPRKGAKTLSFAALMLLESIHKGVDIAHLGAIKDQALRCYGYFSKMLSHPLLSKFKHGKPTKSKAFLTSGATVEILVGTISGVNSPHPCKAQLDEIELMEWPILQEALSMASSMKGYRSSTRLTSTRKFATGTMQTMLDQIEEKNFRLFEWNIWDVCEPCPHRTVKSSTVELPKIGELEVPKDCVTCPLLIPCHGTAKYSHGGIIPLADTMQAYTTLDEEIWESQVVCNRPGTSDLVYPMFDKAIHVIPDESFVYDPDKPVFAAQDAGFNQPASLFAQEVEDGRWVVFAEIYEGFIAPSVLVSNFLVHRQEKYNVQQWITDPNGLTLVAEMELAGLPTILANNNVDEGIDAVRSMFTTGRLLFTSSCTNLIGECMRYRKSKTGRPVKKDDHLMDSLRYFCMEVIQYIGELSEVFK